MQTRIVAFAVTAGAVCLVLATLASGCGGGGGGEVVGATVTGRVVDVSSGFGIAGLSVTVGGRTGVTVDGGGFEVRGVPAGTHAVTVTATPVFVQAPGAPIMVTVGASGTVALPAWVLVVDPALVPPAPS